VLILKFRFTYILALAGLFLLLAHQMVPHCHCPEPERGEMCETQNEDENSWLSEVFGTDIGANHLENYEMVKTQNITPQLLGVLQVFILPQTFIVPFPQLQGISQTSQIPTSVILRGHITSLSLRPPPIG
jgi:hypothetical protein